MIRPIAVLAMFSALACTSAAQEPTAPPTMSGGTNLACAMLDGRAECWGWGVWWRRDEPAPPGVLSHARYFGRAPLPGDPGVVSIEVGQAAFACGLTRAGELYCIGRNGQRRAAPFTEESAARDCGGFLCADSMVRVAAPLTFRAFAPGDQTSCGITHEGRLYCWGKRLDTLAESFVRRPAAVLPALRFRDAAGTEDHMCALTDDGVVWCWAGGPPTRVNTAERFVSLVAARHHRCGLTADGAAWCWGSNGANWMGLAAPAVSPPGAGRIPTSNLPPNDYANAPVRVAPHARFRHLTVSEDGACGVTTDDDLLCLLGDHQARGFEPGAAVASAIPMARLIPRMKAIDATIGYGGGCALMPTREIECWGARTGSSAAWERWRVPRGMASVVSVPAMPVPSAGSATPKGRIPPRGMPQPARP